MIEPGDARAVEVRKDMSMTLTSASKRWFNDLPLKDGSDSMSLMIVSHDRDTDRGRGKPLWATIHLSVRGRKLILI